MLTYSIRLCCITELSSILNSLFSIYETKAYLYLQILCVFGLYIWCAAADPADPGVFKSKKYLKIPDRKKLA